MDVPADRLPWGDDAERGERDSAWVQQAVLARLAPPNMDDDSLHITGPVAANEFSRIYRGEGRAFGCPVAVKLFLRSQFGGSPSAMARAYFDALHAVWSDTTHPPAFLVAQPLGLIEDLGVVVTEWVDGPSLAGHLARASSLDARLAARKAGAWLAQLHATSGVTRRAVDCEGGIARLQDALIRSPGRFIWGRATKAIRLLADASELVRQQSVPWSRSHGDFKPTNLILSNSNVVGIDLDLIHMAPIVRDAAHFLNHAHLQFSSIAAVRRLYAPGPDLGEPFRKGYVTDGGIELPPLPLAWERLRNAVHLLLRNHEWSVPPRSWVSRITLANLVKGLSRDLSDLLRAGTRTNAEHDPAAEHSPNASEDPQARIAYLEDVLEYLVEDDDTFFSPSSDKLVFAALSSSARARG